MNCSLSNFRLRFYLSNGLRPSFYRSNLPSINLGVSLGAGSRERCDASGEAAHFEPEIDVSALDVRQSPGSILVSDIS